MSQGGHNGHVCKLNEALTLPFGCHALHLLCSLSNLWPWTTSTASVRHCQGGIQGTAANTHGSKQGQVQLILPVWLISDQASWPYGQRTGHGPSCMKILMQPI